MTAPPDAAPEFVRAIGPVARELLGEPNRALSSKAELRFGTRGSLAVELAAGTWFDHELGQGGGLLDLVQRERRTDRPGALAWLHDRKHLPPPTAGRARRREVAAYAYTDEDGVGLFEVVRFEPKDFRQRRPDGDGWSWSTRGTRRVLFRLPEVLEAVAAGRTVYVAEGEKAALALVAAGVDATCSPGGAGKWGPAYGEALRGADVVLLPDNDDPGRHHADQVREALAGVAGRVRVLELPGLPEKGDPADWLAAGGDRAALEALAAGQGAEPQPEEDPAPEAEPESDVAAEIARLAGLSAVEFARERRAAAGRLNMTVRDLEKAVRAHRRAAFREKDAAERERQRATPGAVLWPIGFRMTASGLTHQGESEDAVPVTVAGPFAVLGESRTSAGTSWGLWLAWRDRDGREHRWAMRRGLLMTEPGALEAELVERGLNVTASAEARGLLRLALGGVETTARVTAVRRTGWHPTSAGPVFVLADNATIGARGEPVVLLDAGEDAARRVATAGTVEGWREGVAALARGNATAVFAICAGLCGPLLETVGEDGGGVHLYGASRRGKTVAARLAASVWGPPVKGAALRDWRSTANALERECEESADTLLVMDEVQQAEPRDVVSAIYGMGNGGGKARLRADATARARRTWRTFILSNGESDVATIAAKAGQRLPAGAEMRLPSIPLPGALWPELHGRSDFQVLCADLTAAAMREHGTAGRAFVAHLAAMRADAADSERLPRLIAALRDAFVARHVPAGADPQVVEVARRLALVGAAGELAAELGVVPWSDGEATRAAAVMFAAWRDRRGGTGSTEEAEHLDRVRAFLTMHGQSRMQALQVNPGTNALEEAHDPARPVINRVGWRERMANGSVVYYFATATWRDEVCNGLDAGAVARTLIAAGHMERGEGKNLAKLKTIPGLGRPRVYVVRASLMDGEVSDVLAEAA